MTNKYTNPNRILTYNESKMYTNKEYNIIKKQAKLERDKILQQYRLNEDEYPTIKIIEHIINNHEYQDLSPLKKEIMLSNIILPDDTKIINILTENGFTIEHIKIIIKFRGILKNLLLNKSNLSKELLEEIKIYKNVVSKLIEIFYINFHINNSTIILNRLSELLVTKPHLLDSLPKSSPISLSKIPSTITT